jgi:predicted PurR-regulated permease PerM
MQEERRMSWSPCELSGKTAVIGLTAAAILIVLLMIWFGRSLFLLAFAGVLLAVLLRSITNAFKRYLHLPDGLGLALAVAVLLGAAVAFVLLVGPNVQAQANALWQQLPDTLQQARAQLGQHAWGRRVLAQLPTAGGVVSSGKQIAERSLEAVFGVLGIVGNAVVIGFLGLYLAIDPERYARGATRLFPVGWRARIWETLLSAGENLHSWMLGKLLLMIFVGVCTAIGLFFLHIPLIAPLALLAALLDFIPNVGPVISAVPAVLLALSMGPSHALWTALLYLTVQLVESYILQPVVQGKAVSLPPAVLITAQILFGLLLGVSGLILATPLTVVLLVFIKRLYIGAVLEQRES